MIKNPSIAVIGLGYVGLPLLVELNKKFKVIGYDKNNKRIKELLSGFDRTLEVTEEDLNSKKISFALDIDEIKNYNVFIVTVPTPVDKYNNPDMRPLSLACKIIGKILKENDIVIFESTVYPGATEEFCVPILEKESGLKYNSDFFCGYSPERINPGDKSHNLKSIKKVTSGSTNEVSIFVDQLYKSIIPAGTHLAPSIATAEASKVIENIQRDVNIALINEFSMIFNKLGLETNAVLSAAESKWNFNRYNPGLVGGHCIGVDPYYLTHKAKEIGLHPEMILAGRRINDGMSKYISDITISELSKMSINPVGAKVAILGITFKENCPDLRNTKVVDIINNLYSHGCEIDISDPYADLKETKHLYNIDLIDINKISNINAVILAVAHDEYKSIPKNKWQKMFKDKGIFIDVKSIYSDNYFNATKIKSWRL